MTDKSIDQTAQIISGLDEVELRIFLWRLDGATSRRILKILDKRREFVLSQSPDLFSEIERKDDATTDDDA